MPFPIRKTITLAEMRGRSACLLVNKYRLTVSFGLAALVFVLTAALVISYTVGRIAEGNLIRIAERSITSDAVDMLSVIGDPSRPLTLRALADSGGLSQQLPTLAERYSIVKLNLIDPEGVLVWSTERDNIGNSIEVSPISVKALNGNISSTFQPRQELASLDGIRPRLSVVQTSLPLRDPATGEVMGVLEIYRNVTDDVPLLIGATRSSVVRVTAVTMSGLFVVLLIVVVLADMAISRSKRREQVTLENQLAERRKAATALQESNTRLEEVVETLKQTQEQVVRQERLRALGEMASGIAHDFNNALTPILGYSSMLMNSPDKLSDGEALKKQLAVINTAAEDAAAVVSRLREFYRGREEEEQVETLNLNDLAEQAVSLTQAKWKDQAQARGATINIDLKLSDIPSVQGCASEIREALMNLVLNAVDAMPQGGVITLETYIDAELIVLEVSDTGTGMTEEVRQNCLAPFFTTKGSHGTGMGLAMVYGIMQRHDGMMDIRTAVGQGTSFILRFPAPSKSAAEVASPVITPDSATDLRVLVVDDEPMVLKILAEYLMTDGHTVISAADGEEALDKFGEGTVDLVLTDRAMPEMSGDKLAAAIKARSPRTPVILVTGFGTIMKTTGDTPAAVDKVLSKPVGMEDLRLAIAQVMNSAALNPPTPPSDALTVPPEPLPLMSAG